MSSILLIKILSVYKQKFVSKKYVILLLSYIIFSKQNETDQPEFVLFLCTSQARYMLYFNRDKVKNGQIL